MVPAALPNGILSTGSSSGVADLTDDGGVPYARM